MDTQWGSYAGNERQGSSGGSLRNHWRITFRCVVSFLFLMQGLDS